MFHVIASGFSHFFYFSFYTTFLKHFPHHHPNHQFFTHMNAALEMYSTDTFTCNFLNSLGCFCAYYQPHSSYKLFKTFFQDAENSSNTASSFLLSRQNDDVFRPLQQRRHSRRTSLKNHVEFYRADFSASGAMMEAGCV